MALRFVDSFDHYNDNTEFLRKWTADSSSNFLPVAAAGRNGTAGLRYSYAGSQGTGSVSKTLDAQATWTVGLAGYKNEGGGLTAGSFGIEILDVGTVQVGVYLNADGTFSVRRNGSAGTVLETTANSISSATWYHFEFQATIADAGSYAFHVNGADWASGNGDTDHTGSGTGNAIQVYLRGGTGATDTIDDFYACDGTGGVNDDFLGDCRVECLFPSGAGATSAWTPSAGANWQCVDETAPNDDTDYVESSTATNIDTYAYGNLATVSGTVYGVQTVIYARKTDAGARTIDHVAHVAAADYEAGLTQSLTDTYLFHRHVWETDPSDAGAWTIADVNGAEFGIKLEA